MKSIRLCLLASISSMAMLNVSAAAQADRAQYTFDSLGRLSQVINSDGSEIKYAYDAAGNRTQVIVTGGSGTPTPTPTPTPVNHPPVTNPDTGNVARCGMGEFNVTANDTDPDGDYPLTVVSVTGPAKFAVVSASTISYSNFNTTAGTKIGTYTVEDSRGAESTGTLTVTVPAGVCQ